MKAFRYLNSNKERVNTLEIPSQYSFRVSSVSIYKVGLAEVSTSIWQPSRLKYLMYLPTCKDSGSLLGGLAIETMRILYMSVVKKIYNSLRYSSFYPAYLRVFRPAIYRQYRRDVKFYKSILFQGNKLVFDVGANVGDKSFLFSKYCNSVVAVEPDRANYKLLQYRFSSSKKVIVHNVAVGDKKGRKMFYVNAPGSPANTLSQKWKDILQNPQINRWSKQFDFEDAYEVEVITIDELIASHGIPDYIKIDVEGYEWQVLRGLSQSVSVLSFEANFPDFKGETINSITKLHALSNNAAFNITNDSEFFWASHQSYEHIVSWLNETDLKYFEVFCFTRA